MLQKVTSILTFRIFVLGFLVTFLKPTDYVKPNLVISYHLARNMDVPVIQ